LSQENELTDDGVGVYHIPCKWQHGPWKQKAFWDAWRAQERLKFMNLLGNSKIQKVFQKARHSN
jgi:hypothetical protein